MSLFRRSFTRLFSASAPSRSDIPFSNAFPPSRLSDYGKTAEVKDAWRSPLADGGASRKQYHFHRGYWTDVVLPESVGSDKATCIEWFKRRIWGDRRNIRKLAIRFEIPRSWADPHGKDKRGRIMVEWKSFESIKQAYDYIQSIPKIDNQPLVRFKFHPSLWPLHDRRTTTFRISPLSPSENETSIKAQFPYLSSPTRLSIQKFLGERNKDLFAIWECPSNQELQLALKKGPVDAEKGWALRASATAAKLELELQGRSDLVDEVNALKVREIRQIGKEDRRKQRDGMLERFSDTESVPILP